MYGTRLGRIGRRKPHLYFDRRWKVADDMQVGDRGQLSVEIEATRIGTELDIDGIEVKVIEMTVRDAKKLIKFQRRFV